MWILKISLLFLISLTFSAKGIAEDCINKAHNALKRNLNRVVQSENANYLGWETFGDEKQNSSIIIFQFDHKTREYRYVKKIQLRNPKSPRKTYITNSGRYLITVGDAWDG